MWYSQDIYGIKTFEGYSLGLAWKYALWHPVEHQTVPWRGTCCADIDVRRYQTRDEVINVRNWILR